MGKRSGNNAQGCGWLAALGIAILAIGRCGSPATTPAPEPTAIASAAQSTPGYVAARSLRCRNEASEAATVRETLRGAEPVTIAARDGTWSRLTRPGGDCWVATAFLSDTAPETGGSGERDNGASTARRNLIGTRTTNTTGTGQGSDALGAGVGAGTSYAYHRAGTRKARVSYGRLRAGRSTRRSRSPNYFYGDSCPCSGSHICIGPRGGRYCITSGGNKRYGV